MVSQVEEKKWGVVLVNLGTPEQPTAAAVRKFLKDFLGDPRVVEIPRLIWMPILHGIILPFRSPKVAKAYQSIWMDEGSPLMVYSERQLKGVKNVLVEQLESPPLVELAMTYGTPNLSNALSSLENQGAEKYLILPLYPQYSATTTGAIYDQLSSIQSERRNVYDAVIHKNYHYRDDYIHALAQSISSQWQDHKRSEKLLFSFHGIPKRCVDLGDPYYDHCIETANLVAERLELEEDRWFVSFQSRLGKAEWLTPYTDKQLEKWAAEGVNSVDVICPAFSSDCLETIEEINVENRELFIAAGGKDYHMIPCLNDQTEHVNMLANIISEYVGS